MSTDPDEMQCLSCGGADPRCSAFHPEYGFTCIMPEPHSGPHYDTGGGHWTERGQEYFEENEMDSDEWLTSPNSELNPEGFVETYYREALISWQYPGWARDEGI